MTCPGWCSPTGWTSATIRWASSSGCRLNWSRCESRVPTLCAELERNKLLDKIPPGKDYPGEETPLTQSSPERKNCCDPIGLNGSARLLT